MNEEDNKIFTVYVRKEDGKEGKYIRMPKDASGFYIRRICRDGAITFLPVKMPEQPIACQGITPLGGIEK